MELPKMSLWDAVKSLSVLAIVAVFCVKAYETPLTLTVDFPTLLSLLLAIFSVALSALFYFKATDSSNKFYDNTYKFTRDVAQLLAKIESGFGERLRHLDEGYSSMRSYLETRPSDRASMTTEATKQKIQDEKNEVSKVVQQRSQIIRRLLDRSQLQEKEKEEFERQLKQKETELNKIQETVTRLNRQLLMERLRRRRVGSGSGFDRFTKSQVVDKLGIERVLVEEPEALRLAFERLAVGLPKGYMDDLEKHGYYEEGALTSAGIEYLVSVAKKNSA
jgi:hypothetical protein